MNSNRKDLEMTNTPKAKMYLHDGLASKKRIKQVEM